MRKCMVSIILVLILWAPGHVLAQSSPLAAGHMGQIISPHDTTYASDGYVECLNQCEVPHGVPDAATQQALQYADQNGLSGVEYIPSLHYKSVDVCRVNYSNIVKSTCMQYQSSPVTSADQVAASWTGITSPFLSVDLCMQYYPVTGHVSDKLKWPEECGAYPRFNAPLPIPPTQFATGVGYFWTCSERQPYNGIIICYPSS